MVHVAYLMLLFPLAGFVVLVTFGRRMGDPLAGWVGTAAVTGAFVSACVVLAGLIDLPSSHRLITDNYWTWFSSGGLSVPVGTLVDPLSMTMCMFVTGVSALIHLYSVAYMKRDRDFTKFFVYLNLFVFSMVLLVLADNLVLTFVGWEGVGVCSYFLVAFWFERESAASAGKKAFIYNRIGDAGFLLAIFLLFEKTGTVQYTSGPGGGIFGQLSHLSSGTATAAVLLLFLAAAGKSAQIPLFNWLPDAMEGPTPVSALIHAATMVTAGVYLLCRMNPLLHLTSSGMTVIAVIGTATAFVAATIACAQQDIKKVLAFSTVSQIGYMMLAVGSGAYVAAIFLMVMHAFFKALLFLGAGSVIHGLDDEQDLKRMGAIRRYMRWTTVTFTVGWLAIIGIPPLSGFFAKGDVLDNAYSRYEGLWVIALVTAVLTAYYMSRLEILAFGGEPRFESVGPHGEPARHTPHESNWIMLTPLVVLAFLSLFGEVLNLPWAHTHSLNNFLAPVFSGDLYNDHLGDASQWVLGTLDAVAAVIGVIVAAWLWRGSVVDKPALEPAFLQRVWYWDDVYDTVIGRPSQRLAMFCAWVVDTRIIDGAVNGTAHLVRATGSAARRLQTGYARNYALGIALGMALVIAFMLADVVELMHIVPFLTVLVLLPAAGAIGLALLGLDRRLHRELTYALALIVSLVTLGFAVAAMVAMKVHDGGFQLVTNHQYTGVSLGVHWYLGVDGISIFLVLLTAVLFPLAIVLGRNRENARVYFAWILLLEAAVMGSFLSLDLIVFFFMFELTLVPAYFIIAGWGHQRRAYAAIKFFLYTFLGSAFLLVGILVLAFIHQSQYHYLTFSLGPLMQTHLSSSTEILLFLAFTAAFAVKAPLFPLHTWSPDAYTEAPEEGSVLLSGVLAKLGTYGIIRFDLSLFPHATRTLGPLVLTLAVIGIIYGAVVACAQRDLKRLVTYSSLAQIGFIALGAIAISTQGLAGGVLLMVNHGLIVAALFILIGFIYQRRGTWQAGELRGLQKAAPVLAAVFTVSMLASIGLPGLNGFVSEFLVLSGTFLTHRWWAVVAVGGVIVAAIYLLWGYQQVFHGAPRPADEKTRDLALLERCIMAPLIILIVFLGVYPKPVLDRINPSVNQLIAHVESRTGQYQPSVAVKGVEGTK